MSVARNEVEQLPEGLLQPVDPLDQRDVGGAVIAAIAAAFQRLQLGKLPFPIAQDVLLDAERASNFADGAQRPLILAVIECRVELGHQALPVAFTPGRCGPSKAGSRGKSAPGAR